MTLPLVPANPTEMTVSGEASGFKNLSISFRGQEDVNDGAPRRAATPAGNRSRQRGRSGQEGDEAVFFVFRKHLDITYPSVTAGLVLAGSEKRDDDTNAPVPTLAHFV